VSVDGCINMPDRIGRRVIERLIPALISPESHLTLVYSVFLPEASDWLSMARQSGLEVTTTAPLDCEWADAFAVCVGPAWALSSFSWTQEIVGMKAFLVLACRTIASEFEVAAVDAARSGASPIDVAARILDGIDKAPASLDQCLGEWELLAYPTDSHQLSLQICMREPDTETVSALLRKAANHVGVRLFDAGDLGRPDKHGHYFTDFHAFEQWQPLPRHWREVVG